MSIRLVLLSILFALVACNGPTGLLPGGELDGDTQPAPAAWSSLDEYGTAQLETRPEDPYSVNIAYTVLDGRVYINAGDTETEWVKNIAADPNVRLRIDGAIYDLRADRVMDAEEIAAFGKVWASRPKGLPSSRSPHRPQTVLHGLDHL